jgi:hypothetical protein
MQADLRCVIQLSTSSNGDSHHIRTRIVNTAELFIAKRIQDYADNGGLAASMTGNSAKH